jgi:hypothetical protein
MYKSKVYLNCQRFGLFIRDFEKYSIEEKQLCVRRIKYSYPVELLSVLKFFLEG